MKPNTPVTNSKTFANLCDIYARCEILLPSGIRVETRISDAAVVYEACKNVSIERLKKALNAPLPEKLRGAAYEVMTFGEMFGLKVAPEWREAVAKLLHHEVVKSHWANQRDKIVLTRNAELPSAIVLMALALRMYHGNNIHNTPHAIVYGGTFYVGSAYDIGPSWKERNTPPFVV